MKVEIDAGPQTNRVFPSTTYAIDEAAKDLSKRLRSVAGRDFWGKVIVSTTWQAGRLMAKKITIEETEQVASG